MVCTVTGSRSPAKPRSPSWLRHLLAISARDPAGGRTYCCHYDSRVIMLHYTTGSSNWKKEVNPQRSVMPQVLVLLDSKTPHGKAFEFLNSTRDDEPRVFQSSNRGAALIFSVPREKAWKGAAPKEPNGNKARVGGGSRRRGGLCPADGYSKSSVCGRERGKGMRGWRGPRRRLLRHAERAGDPVSSSGTTTTSKRRKSQLSEVPLTKNRFRIFLECRHTCECGH
jgi:hypothetical protein